MRRMVPIAILLFATFLGASGAEPPALVNYQGVLRDASDRPLSGLHDMVFTFYSADAGGDQILIDSHTFASGGQVTVSGGLFNLQLGSGAVADGSGPGTYTSLDRVFGSYGEVWLEVRVGVETLSPRTRITSVAYSINAAQLDGKHENEFAQLAVANTFSTGTQTIQSGSSTTKGLVLRGTAGQSVDLQEWQDGTGAVVASVGPNGVFAGNGSGLTALNASGLTSGTLPSAQLSGAYSNALTFNNPANSFTGSGAGLTNLDATDLASGTLPSARLSGTYSNALTFSNVGNSFTGSGAGLTNLDATDLASGTLPSARLSGTYSNVLTFSNVGNSFTGSGAGLTNLDATDLASGTLPSARLSGTYSNALTFSNVGNSFTGSGAGLTNLDATDLASGTLPSARLSGTYSNALTFSNVGNSFTGSGAGLTNLDATDLVSGTLPSARLSGTYSNALNFSNVANSFTGNGSGLSNVDASELGGHAYSDFLNTSTTAQTKTGKLTVIASAGGAIVAKSEPAGWFENTTDSRCFAILGGSTGDYGVEGSGLSAGGSFSQIGGDAQADVASEGSGINATGVTTGGFFRRIDSGSPISHAYLGHTDSDGDSYGVEAYGNSGSASTSNVAGGYFADRTTSPRATARIAWADSSKSYGVWAQGNQVGGFFQRNLTGFPSAHAYLGHQSLTDLSYFYGVEGYGNSGAAGTADIGGGYFADRSNTPRAAARIGWIDSLTATAIGVWTFGREYGVFAGGNNAGGYFYDWDNIGDGNAYAYVGQYASGVYYKAKSNGTNSFVQNHPEVSGQVIVYAAPEGDEVAVYTRGTARMVDGEARVALGETFKWVANPDVGLTAHLTPVGSWADLYIDSKSTSEIVVRSQSGDPNAVFDYVVYGLRIGFERMPTIQAKEDYSPVPPPGGVAEYYAQHPGLTRSNALERFQAESASLGMTGALDLSRSQAMVAAINRFDPDVDGTLKSNLRHQEAEARSGDRATESRLSRGDQVTPSTSSAPASPMPTPTTPVARAEWPRGEEVGLNDEGPSFPVSEPVEPGDLLVLDPIRPGHLKRADAPADPTVAGIVAREMVTGEDGEPQAPMVDGLYAVVKADASYGAILAGDLLVTSATPGHVMKAPATSVPGTILGKALESLGSGTGPIKVLVMLR